MSKAFSKTYLESLRPESKRQFFLCKKIHGLGIAVYPSGTKRFFFRRRTAEFDTGRIVIGTWRDGRVPDMTIQQASDRCRNLNELINAGINPAQQRKDRKASPSFGDLYNRYLSDHVQIHNKSDVDPKSHWKLYLKGWKSRKVIDITTSDVSALFSDIARQGKKATANHVLSMIHAMFEHAFTWGYLPEDKANPAARVKKIKKGKRTRKLEDDEFPIFMQVLKNYRHRDSRDAILLAMYTGQRINNVLSMKWADIIIKNKLWLIPDTKSGHPSRLPLSDVAVEILINRRGWYKIMDNAKASPSRKARNEQRRKRMMPFVFRGRGKSGHFTTVGKAWREIRQTTGTEGLNLHDLRRTFVSLNANHGTDLIIASKLASHRNISTTAEIYSIVDEDPMREAVNKTAQIIRRLSHK